MLRHQDGANRDRRNHSLPHLQGQGHRNERTLNHMVEYTLGLLFAMLIGVSIGVVIMGAMASGKIADAQQRRDE